MARLRYNGLTATLGAPLTNSGTTITFAAALTSAAGAVPTIAGGDIIPLSILDGAGKVSEIVSLTAYTSGATTGTIARAQEGTTGVAHAAGDGVVHGATVADFASSGSAAQSYGGNNTAGASFVTATNRRILLKKITIAAPALVASVSTYIKGTGNVHGWASGLWADAAGAPGDIIAASAFPPSAALYIPNTTGQWFAQPIGSWVAAGDYWIGSQFRSTTPTTGAWQIAYDGSGSDRYLDAGGDWVQGFAAGVTTATTNNYSIRANLITL